MSNKKYEFIAEKTLILNGKKLTKIRALISFECRGFKVNAGDEGGYIENEENLDNSTADNSWVYNHSYVYNNSRVSKNSRVYSSTVDNSTVDNSTVDHNSDVSNSTLNNSTVYSSTVSNSTVDSSAVDNSSTVANNSRVDNTRLYSSTVDNNSDVSNSTVANSTLNNSRVDNSTVDSSAVDKDNINSCNPISIVLPIWKVTITKEKMTIGCKSHSIVEWKLFTDEEISDMDTQALSWWNKYKKVIFDLIELNNEGNKSE